MPRRPVTVYSAEPGASSKVIRGCKLQLPGRAADSNQYNAVGNSSDCWELIENQGGIGVAAFALWGDKGLSSSVAADLLHWTCTSEEKISVVPGTPPV